MGDTGSLTIGGIIAVYAIIIHKELLIPILCGIFLVENLSVILQRLYHKKPISAPMKAQIKITSSSEPGMYMIFR